MCTPRFLRSCQPPPHFPLQFVGGAAASPAPASLSELPAYPADFLRRRWLSFIGIVLGYSCFYLTRNSLTYTAPAMVGTAGTCVPGRRARGMWNGGPRVQGMRARG